MHQLRLSVSTRKSLKRFLQACAPLHSQAAHEYTIPEVRTNAYISYDETAKSIEDIHGVTNSLERLPIAVKDNICTKSFKTTCSSVMLRDFVSPYDATVVRLLRASGARIVGKTNCDEFGMGSYNIHSAHGPVLNPYRPPKHSESLNADLRSAGGSSGGSAAAVASDTCFAALGTDTGGSVRLPASYCGVAGLKPSYGIISRWGVISYADSLDCVGILAKSAEDIKPVLNVLSRHDPKDPASASENIRKKAATLENACLAHAKTNILDGLAIGIPQEYFPEELDQGVVTSLQGIIKLLKAAGARVIPVSLPSTPYALSAYYVIASAEASSNLARYSGIHYGSREELPTGADRRIVSEVYSHSRSKGFGCEVQKRILLGTYALTADAFDNYFLQAQRVRQLLKRDFNRIFNARSPLYMVEPESSHRGEVDILLHPSTIGSAPSLAAIDKSRILDAYVQDVLTVPASLAGLPALSIPAGTGRDGWPLGVSVVGQWGFDRFVLEVGSAIEHLIKQ